MNDNTLQLEPGAALHIISDEPSADNAIIFIHGILSNPSVFNNMFEALKKEYPNFEFCSFEYDFWDEMGMNAEKLYNLLSQRYTDRSSKNANLKITLICHSMGGLIARLVALRHELDLSCLSRIIMLGTPNFGAVKITQLVHLTQMSCAVIGKVGGLFIRKRGVFDLMRAQTIIDKELANMRMPPEEKKPIDYITTAGKFYHDERPFYQVKWDREAGNFKFFLISAIAPLIGGKLRPPHDGIVEYNSVDLAYSEDRHSEKWHWIFRSGYYDDPQKSPNYLYIEPIGEAKELTHTMLQNNAKIIELIKDVLRFPELKQWNRKSVVYSYLVKPPKALVSS